jgi:hypothetical protein
MEGETSTDVNSVKEAISRNLCETSRNDFRSVLLTYSNMSRISSAGRESILDFGDVKLDKSSNNSKVEENESISISHLLHVFQIRIRQFLNVSAPKMSLSVRYRFSEDGTAIQTRSLMKESLQLRIGDRIYTSIEYF